MKKRILCIVLAVLIFGSAIGFAIYNKFGKTFDYAEKDMSKYLPTITDKAFVEALYNGTAERQLATDEEVAFLLATKLATLNKDENKKEEGEMGLYDTIQLNYYITLDGKVVSDPAKMALGKKTSVQLGADNELALLMAALAGKDITEGSLPAFTTGDIREGDSIWVDCTIKVGDSVEKTVTYQRVVVSGTDYMEDIYAGLTAKFEEKRVTFKNPAEIGKTLNLTLVEAAGETPATTADVTVQFASRTIVTKGDMVNGDTVYFYYKEDDGESVKYNVEVSDSMDLDATFGIGFTAAFREMKIGDNKTIEATKAGAESATSYAVTIEYAKPVDPTDTAREGLRVGDKPIVLTATYPEDSETTVYGDSEEKLAGKEVQIYVYPASFNDIEYGYAAVMEELKFAASGDTAVEKYLTAYKAHKEGSEKTGDDALSEEELAKLASDLEEAKTAYEAELGESETADPDVAAKAAYEESLKKEKQSEYNRKHAYVIAQNVWENLLAAVENSVTYPSKAVRLALKGIEDNHKSEYYEKADDYAKYASFKDYLRNEVYKDYEDYKAQMKAEAQDIVLKKMVLYRLVEIYEVTLTDTQELMAQIYAYNNSRDGYVDEVRAGYLFDNVMQVIAEDICPELKD